VTAFRAWLETLADAGALVAPQRGLVPSGEDPAAPEDLATTTLERFNCRSPAVTKIGLKASMRFTSERHQQDRSTSGWRRREIG
jgi:hypothetical protein